MFTCAMVERAGPRSFLFLKILYIKKTAMPRRAFSCHQTCLSQSQRILNKLSHQLWQSRPAQGSCWLKMRAANSAKPPTRIADILLLGIGSGGSSNAEGLGAGAYPIACVPNTQHLVTRH